MRSVIRVMLCIALLAVLVVAPATVAQAETTTDADVVEIVARQCPEGYSGVILDFFVGNPPQHVFTLRACQNIV